MSSSETTDHGTVIPGLRAPDGSFGARHLFTTRRGGVGRAPFDSANLGDHVGDDPDVVRENRRRVAQSFGVEASAVHWARQVHGREVWNVDRGRLGRSDALVEADALVSATPGTVLAIATADCVPLLLVEPSVGVVAAVHAGWRGAAVGVVEHTVASLVRDHSVSPGAVQAVIGPAVEGACYQVGTDVVDALRGRPGFERAVSPDGSTVGRALVDVATLVTASLVAVGVPERSIVRLAACTVCDADRWFSHRRDGPRTGRQAAFVQVPLPGNVDRS